MTRSVNVGRKYIKSFYEWAKVNNTKIGLLPCGMVGVLYINECTMVFGRGVAEIQIINL